MKYQWILCDESVLDRQDRPKPLSLSRQLHPKPLLYSSVISKKCVAHTACGYSVGRGQFSFIPGQWTTIRQIVKLNSFSNGKYNKWNWFKGLSGRIFGTGPSGYYYTEPMLLDHNAKDVCQRHARLQRNKQRFWSNAVNQIFAVNNVMSAKSKSLKNPIILFGDGNFANVKGCLPGNYAWL